MTRRQHDDPALRPMLATLEDAPLVDANLVYEPKYDGIRALVTVTVTARAGGADVAIASRLGNDKSAQFPEVIDALAAWGRRRRKSAVLDGEIVALDAARAPAGFGQLQGRMHLGQADEVARRAADTPVALFVFDALRDGDDDLRALPLAERRRRLEAMMARAPGDVLRLAAQARGDGTALLAEAQARGWEGIVAKDARSIYRSGRRTRDWRKLKLVKRQELVVGGFTEPRGSRAWLGALIVGVPGAGGKLRYAGHVGGGFADDELARVGRLLRARVVAACPFASPPPVNGAPHWVRPDLVAEVRFAAWTADGRLREPVFLGLRDDVAAAGVRREQPAPRPIVTVAAPPAPASRRAPAGERQRTRLLDAIDELADKGGGRLALADGVALELGNLKKRLWPRLGLSKADLLRYYVRASPFLLPVVRDRPLVMRRFPDGLDGPAFYQHRAPDDVPRGVRAQRIRGDDDVPSRFVGGDLATLLYMTQLAAISQDPWFSRAQSPADLDFAAIDLDPMDAAPFSRVRDVARWVGDELDALGVVGALKTSGASGLHIYLPMRPGTPFQAGMLFCQIVASVVAARHPDAATVERAVKKRDPASVYIDCLQNVPGKTLACAYSARASDYAGASTPLEWRELDGRLDPRAFTITTLPGRLREVGDLWARLGKGGGVDLERALDAARTRHG